MSAEKLLQECRLQLEYLNEKFGETGTTNALLSKLEANQPKDEVTLESMKKRFSGIFTETEISIAFHDLDYEMDCHGKYAEKPQQQSEADLQEFAIWMTGCGYDFTQHEYYMKNKHLLTNTLNQDEGNKRPQQLNEGKPQQQSELREAAEKVVKYTHEPIMSRTKQGVFDELMRLINELEKVLESMNELKLN